MSVNSEVDRVGRALQVHEWGSDRHWSTISERSRDEYRARAAVALEACHYAKLVDALALIKSMAIVDQPPIERCRAIAAEVDSVFVSILTEAGANQ